MRSRGFPNCLLAMLTLALPLSAAADFKRDYGTGLKALQDGDLDRAVQQFESAIADNPESAERVRIYGMRYEPYLPYFYLGEARFQQGDCTGALAAWQEAENRGVIQNQDSYSSLQDHQASCSRAMLDPAQLASARSALQDLSDAVTQLDDVRSRMGGSFTASWQSALDSTQRRLSEYQTQLAGAEAASDAGEVDRIAAAAMGDTDNLRSLQNEASQRLAALDRQRQAERLAQQRTQARSELTQAVASARTELDRPTPDPSLATQSQALLVLVNRESELQSGASPREYQALTRQINAGLREYRQAVQEFNNQQRAIAERTPPDELRAVAELYFSGRYDEVPALVNPSAFSDERARVQALLFRAAARFHAYTLSGESQDSLLRQAENDIRSIKRLNQDFSPYLAAFPPKFMNLFDRTL
ncbi:MAG: hypothetical protein AAGA23_15140 [Pseudomonadota bacterium]